MARGTQLAEALIQVGGDEAHVGWPAVASGVGQFLHDRLREQTRAVAAKGGCGLARTGRVQDKLYAARQRLATEQVTLPFRQGPGDR